MGTETRARAAIDGSARYLAERQLNGNVNGLPASRAQVGSLPHAEDRPAAGARVIHPLSFERPQRLALDGIGQASQVNAVSGHSDPQSAARPHASAPMGGHVTHVSHESARGAGRNGGRMESAGRRIAEMRRARGWSQTELALRIGVSRQQVMRYETRGIQNMRVRRLARLCDELGCSADALLGIGSSGSEE